MMVDFVIDFLEWLEDLWNSIAGSAREAAKTLLVIVGAILTIPVWLFPFVVWLIFVKLKGGEGDG